MEIGFSFLLLYFVRYPMLSQPDDRPLVNR